MSNRKNSTALHNRQGGEKLKKQCHISGETDRSPRISGINEHAIRTEGDGRSPEPINEDLYGDKTRNKTAEVEIQEVNTKTGKDSSSEKIMSGKEQDNEDDENDRDSVDSNENNVKTEGKPIKSEKDLLNSKYDEDTEVDYNNLYENLPSSEEQEEYLPEEFRIPSSLSSASSTISEVSLKNSIKRRNREESNDETTLKEESVNTEQDVRVDKDGAGENERHSVDGDQDDNCSEFRSETEEEESEEEEEETEEDDEEDEEQEKVEEEEADYKSSSVESCSSVPTFYSDREEEETSRPTTASFEEIPEPTGISRLSLDC